MGKWTISEYQDQTTCEWYFDDDFLSFAILGNRDFKEAGNEDIINLYNNLDNIYQDYIDRKEDGDDAESIRNDVNYYFNFKTEALKDFARPLNESNFKEFEKVMAFYEKYDEDEETTAKLLKLFTGKEADCTIIRGSVQSEWNNIIYLDKRVIEGATAAYFGTGAEVRDEDDCFYFIPIHFCTDEEAKNYIIKNWDKDAEVFKEVPRYVTLFDYEAV